DQDGRFPRPKRRRRRAKSDRGLPPDQELADLARAYLQSQRKLWPKLADSVLLPEASREVVDVMVADFKDAHLCAPVDIGPVTKFLDSGPKLAGNYDRYSAEQSNPKSIIDQLINCLTAAHREDRFVPWHFVFADYSVSGLDS